MTCTCMHTCFIYIEHLLEVRDDQKGLKDFTTEWETILRVNKKLVGFLATEFQQEYAQFRLRSWKDLQHTEEKDDSVPEVN